MAAYKKVSLYSTQHFGFWSKWLVRLQVCPIPRTEVPWWHSFWDSWNQPYISINSDASGWNSKTEREFLFLKLISRTLVFSIFLANKHSSMKRTLLPNLKVKIIDKSLGSTGNSTSRRKTKWIFDHGMECIHRTHLFLLDLCAKWRWLFLSGLTVLTAHS